LESIAAADAICCVRLGHRSRDADHRTAAGLIAAVHPEGAGLARALRIALEAKDPMHYAGDYLSPERHTSVLRAATVLNDPLLLAADAPVSSWVKGGSWRRGLGPQVTTVIEAGL
jgi:hypothetical protein